ncbi:hypothetical protein [Streptomyces spectabilis]|uniref:hypothetical protein n=1 Tax=Streptomyces spectabilis TaxID=68270 RepID=UPI00161918F8|nr:hypothetical protein [Streptomyces spectabilis]MCI3907777.1 hypothetical protein [Streptomyces spectabilis]
MKPALLVCAALSLTLMTGCTGDSDGSDEPTGKARPTSGKSAQAHDEQKLGKRVKEALGTETIDDSDPLFVEAGLERVSDGLHARPELAKGTSYELAIACAGTGKISLSVRGGKPAQRTVDCDGVPATHRTVGSPEQLEIDTKRLSGATGMVGWRISKTEK